MPTVIRQENFQKEVMESSLPVIIDVYATWCGPCQQMAPIFEELEKEYSQVCRFAKLNVDDDRDLSVTLGIASIPTFIFAKNGKIENKITGYIGKNEFKEKIDTFLRS